jgi:DnaJ-class molecular chaperone
MADLYTTLGVPKTADAAAIKRAYRKLAKELHPDKTKDNPKLSERFKQVSSAYDILSDEKKRAAYDRGEIDEQGNPKMSGFGGGFRGAGARPGNGSTGGFGGGGFRDMPPDFDFGADPSDLFAELFGRAGGARGGYRPPPQKGADIAYRVPVPFVEAALARPRRLTLANGKTIDLAIPKGVEDGQQLRLAGQGQVGPGGSGDGIVTIQIQPDARFTRDGFDIRTDIAVPLATAVLGGQQRVPTPEGEVMLNIAPGTTSGKVMRLKGKGWTKKDGSRGDLLAKVLVDVPADPELAAFLRARVSGSGVGAA